MKFIIPSLLIKWFVCLNRNILILATKAFGKSKAFYFKDPDGIILEMMQPL